jgi:hypothetical protein
MKQINEIDNKPFDWWKKWEKEINDYNNWNEEYRQEYWNNYVCKIWWYDQRWTSLPIDIKKIREETEKDIEKYIPKIIELLAEEWFTWNIEDIFILDEQAKEYLQRKDIKERIEKILL